MLRILQMFSKVAFSMLLISGSVMTGQTTVFSDDFNTSAGTTYTTATGAIGTSAKWSLTRSGNDFGARINSGILSVTNDSGGTSNSSGWAMAGANTATFAAPYNQILSSNAGVVTWTFNLRQPRSNPNGFLTGYYAPAFILAGTSGTTNVSGTGYAIVLGNSGKTDPIRLVRYTAGIRTFTSMLSSNTTGLTDFGTQYLSVKVTYTPNTNTWQLFVRNDGTSFQDPATGVLALQGTVVNNTYTASVLGLLGAFWNGGTNSNQAISVDNVKVTVAIPQITSITPPSKIAGSTAFTLTVNGSNFVSGVSTVRWNGVNRATNFISATQLTAAITAADIAAAGTAAITVANSNAVSNSVNFTIDAPLVPSLAVSTTALASVNTISGTASPAVSYTISGTDLSADAVLTAPANFEISKTAGSGYAGSLILTRTGTALTGQPLTIYSRIKATAPAGIFSGDITNAATGATTKLVAVSGTALALQPATQGSGITFTSVTSAGFTVNWTNGSGANRLVVIRSGGAVNSAPVDGMTYAASTGFSNGTEIGTGNYVVYNGSGNSVNVTGLSALTTYHIAIYDFNGTSGTENYLTSSPPTGNRTTLNLPVGWQIFATNTINLIDFDNTVDGVNLDAFQGDGMAPTSEIGELNSNAWAISGFSDGAIGFGGTSEDDTDYDRGASEGDVTEGGIYAFETSPENFSLGFQPATGDFAPGSATLRFQNQTGSTVNSLSIGYKIYVRNDEAASTSFNFAHSADNSAYTSVAGLSVVTPAAADVDPQWKAYYRVVTITGLNITNNNYYYLRWNAATASGSISFDEIALDDIQLTANPSTNFATFAGNAAGFVVSGNATLADNTTVNGDLVFSAGKLSLNGKTLTIGGAVTNTVTGALRSNALSNVVVTGTANPVLSFDQTTPGTTNLLNNLTIATNSGSVVTLGNPVIVNGSLSTSTNQTLNLGTNALTGNLTTIANNGILLTQNTTALPLPTGKTWSGTGTVNYNATTAQTVVVGTYNNLTISNAAGAIAAGSLTVNGILHLPLANPNATTGSLSMGSNTLTMGGNATNTGIGDVTGITTRNTIVANTLYTFGQTNTSIVFPAAGTLPSSMSLKVTIGAAPTWQTGAILREFDFIQTGAVDTKAVIRAHYLDSELNSNSETKLVDWANVIWAGQILEQGRSNYNTVDNWVELTNVNVGLYFKPTFNQVKLTLDESGNAARTWNGSVSTSWTTAANWTPNGTPSDDTLIVIPDAATTPRDPILNPAVLLGTLLIETGGILNAPDNSQFTLNGAGGTWINNGTFNPGGGTSNVIFTNADATIAGTTNFNNLTINANASLRPVTNNYMRIAGTLTNNGTFLAGVLENTVEYTGTNQIITNPNSLLGAYHNLTISGSGAIFPETLSIKGNLTFNQNANLSGKTINMIGTELQTIGGTVSPQFDNLIINNTFGRVNLAVDSAISGTLTLTAGRLNIGNTTLTLGANPVAGTFNSANMIVASGTGEVRRPFSAAGSYLFPIGDSTGTSDYAPLTVNVTSGSFSNAYIGVAVTDAVHPNNSSMSNSLSRYWTVRQSGITGAVATISGNYVTADIIGTESEIAAAQLVGTFNQQTNPWIKFAPVASNTLTTTAVALTSGQPNYFTGIKGANFSVQVTGYGSFCQNDAVTVNAELTGGDGPFTFFWSNGLGTNQTANPSAATPGNTLYTVIAKDNNGITATDSASIEILTPSVGGNLPAVQYICSGTAPSDIALSGQIGNVLYWQSASDAAFTNPTNISNVTTILTAADTGMITSDIYYRAVVQNGSCAEVYSTPVLIGIRSTTWNGSSWSNGAPDSTISAIISGNYTATSDLNACSLTVNNNAVVLIPSSFDVNLYGALHVNSGSFTLQNNANLVQVTPVANTGNIIVKRNSSALMRLDYTLWSSPVASQNMLAFSPLTSVTPTSRFYNYNTVTHEFNSIASPSTTLFTPASGYLIRMPNNHPTTPTIWNGQFTGVPNNGNYTFTIGDPGTGLPLDLVGNPYPSPISATAFVTQNAASITGTLYFWRKTNSTSTPTYCYWTSEGGFVSNGQAETYDPLGIIQTGQGFFVEGKTSNNVVTFQNSQRSGNNAGQFFRSSDDEKHRIWLNVTGTNGEFAQMLVGYFTDATLGVDQNIDAKHINEGLLSLTPVIDNTNYVIEGRPVPFDINDVVPLNFKATVGGTYSIAIDHVDGLFSEGQQIYLRDNLTGTVHNLSTPYTFTTDGGTFGTRFEVLYQSSLGTDNPLAEETVAVLSKNGSVLVQSGNAMLESVQIYDVRGRLIAEKTDLNANETAIVIKVAQQVLIVKATTTDKVIFTRKVIH